MAMKFCPSCKRNVNTEYRINWIVAFIFLLLGLLPGVIYIIWGLWKRRCPICKMPDKMLQAPRFDFDDVDQRALP